MKRLCSLILTFFIITVTNSYSQYIKLDNGISMSSFHNTQNLSILNRYNFNYNLSIGADYLESNWYSVSSQIGYIQVGGQETNNLLDVNMREIKESKGFFNANTTFRGYIKSGNTKYFIGAGPYINILAANDSFKSNLYNGYRYKTTHLGILGEIGITQDINNFRIGIIGSYMKNLSSTASTSFINLGNNVFNARISIGYKVR